MSASHESPAETGRRPGLLQRAWRAIASLARAVTSTSAPAPAEPAKAPPVRRVGARADFRGIGTKRKRRSPAAELKGRPVLYLKAPARPACSRAATLRRIAEICRDWIVAVTPYRTLCQATRRFYLATTAELPL